MTRLQGIVIVHLLCSGLLMSAVQAEDSFATAAVGSLPAGWTAAKTGTGDGSVGRFRKTRYSQ
jgi:hypothetical protein